MLLSKGDQNLEAQNSTLQKAVVVTMNDSHINSTVGLCPKLVNLDDGGTYHPSKTQRWLLSCYTDFWARVNVEAVGYRKILMIIGDLGELDCKRYSAQLITQNKATILSMVRDVLDLATWDALYIVRGTRAHTGRSAWLEEEIGSDVSAVQSDNGVFSWWHIRAMVEGVRFDVSHHASMGRTPWVRTNSTVKLASECLWNYKVERDAIAPDVILRAHNHIYSEARVKNTSAYFLPSWTTKTEFVYRVGQENTLADVGGMAFYCDGGKVTPKLYSYTPERERKVWQMKI